MADWQNLKWCMILPVLTQKEGVGNLEHEEITSKLAPGLLGFRNKLFCVWVDYPSEQLSYAVFKPVPTDVKDDKMFFNLIQGRPKLPVRGQRAKTAPALASFMGNVHMVFVDGNYNLVHLQYNEILGDWGQMVGLVGAKTDEPPCLGVYEGKLCCVYKDKAVDNERLVGKWWSKYDGWYETFPIQLEGIEDEDQIGANQRALYELDGQMYLLASVTARGEETKTIKSFQYRYCREWPCLDASLVPPISSSFGVNAVSYNDTIFIACASEEKVTVKQISAGKIVDDWIPLARTTVTPAVAVVNNDVVFCWPDGSLTLQSATRRALAVPDPSCWMAALKDDCPISSLTIPGAHDAAAAFPFAKQGWNVEVPFTKTQTLPISSMLELGVRYIDLRAAYPWQYWGSGSKTTLCAFHGPVELGTSESGCLTIESIFDDICAFLDRNGSQGRPTEGLIVQIKQDRNADNPDEALRFADSVKKLIEIPRFANRWLLGPAVPTMGQLRGKIQLVRRFEIPAAWGNISYGINVSGINRWLDNGLSRFQVVYDKQKTFWVQIQDHWELVRDSSKAIILEKFQDVTEELERAKSDPDFGTLHLNFASANSLKNLISPTAIALGAVGMLSTQYENGELVSRSGGFCAGVNSRMLSYFNNPANVRGRYGVVLFDFPHEPDELLAVLIRSNWDKFKC